MKNLMGKVGLVLLVAILGVVCVAEATNLRDRVERLQAEREAQRRAKQWKLEAAERQEQARIECAKTEAELLDESHPHLEKTRETILVLEKELLEKQSSPQGFTAPGLEPPRDSIVRKIKHLEAAAGHLGEAGMKELAEKIRREAQEMKWLLHRGEEQPSAEILERLDRLADQLLNMRAEIEKLRDDVAELRRPRPRDTN